MNRSPELSDTYLSLANLRRGVVLALIVALGYFIPDNFIVFPVHQVVMTRFDHWVALSPVWIWFYISYYALLIWAYFFTTGTSAQRVYFEALTLSSLVGFVVFFFFPTIISRDLYPWTGVVDYSSMMLEHIRGADVPVNCLPSMHVCMSFVAAACISLCAGRVGRALVWAWFLAICYSTMATKQHYFVDIVAGFSLGLTSIAIFMRRHGLLPDFTEMFSAGGSGSGPLRLAGTGGSSPVREPSRRARWRAAVARLRKRA